MGRDEGLAGQRGHRRPVGLTLSASQAGKVRNAGIDLVRILGVLAIVAGHIWFDEPFHSLVFSWHVPIFFFLSGWLSKRRPLRDEIGARARSLLKPYAFWFTVLYVVYVFVLLGAKDVTPSRLLSPVYGGRLATEPFSTFWFVFVLFAAAVLWQLVNRAPWWAVATVLTTSAAASVAFGSLLALTPLAVGSALPALLFVAAGAGARRLGSGLAVTLVTLGVGVIGVGLILAGWSAPLDIKRGDWGTPIVSVGVAIAISWALVVVAVRISRLLPARVASAATMVALTGFTVVLVHPAVLWSLRAYSVPDAALMVLAILIPAGIATVALRTPLSQWITGAPRVEREISR